MRISNEQEYNDCADGGARINFDYGPWRLVDASDIKNNNHYFLLSFLEEDKPKNYFKLSSDEAFQLLAAWNLQYRMEEPDAWNEVMHMVFDEVITGNIEATAEEEEEWNQTIKEIIAILITEGYTDIEFDYQDGEDEMYFDAFTDGEVQVRVDFYSNEIKIYDKYVTDKHFTYLGTFHLTSQRTFTGEDIARVNWYAETPEFTTFEFEFKENQLFNADNNIDFFGLFRLFVWKDTGKMEIMVANSEDYDIHEDVTDVFDVNSVYAACIASQPDIHDSTSEYLAYYQKEEK
jgi:hypothetical protein